MLLPDPVVRFVSDRRIAALWIAVLVAACVTAASPATTPAVQPSLVASVAATPGAASASPEVTVMPTSPSPASLSISSSAFRDGEAIPSRYSCRGRDISPELRWSGVPSAATALVLIVDDPDGHDWVHWTVLDLPVEDGGLPEGVDPTANRPRQGQNDFHRVGYGGPCPPSGTHHYRFTLYALAEPLGLEGHPDGAAVRRALAAADVVARSTLTGTFRA